MEKIKLGLYITCLLCILACGDDPVPTPPAPTPVVASKLVAPAFNADSAYMFVKKQCEWGPRVPGTSAHQACARWLFNTLKKYTKDVIIHKQPVTTFDGKKFITQNIIASFNPKASRRFILAAHWDTRPFADQDSKDKNIPIMGANDGASGVGILLEIARQFSIQSPETGVDIFLFDLEDYGQPENSNFPPMADSYCLGSQAWARNPHSKNYKAEFGILLDMVGGENARFSMDGTSMSFAPEMVNYVWSIAAECGYANFLFSPPRSPIIDDHYYIQKITGIPVIDIIEHDANTGGGFSKTWHTHQDDMSHISVQTLKSVGQTVMEFIYREKL